MKMKAKEAKRLCDSVHQRAATAKAGNIYIESVLKEIKDRARYGYSSLTIRSKQMNLTDKDVTDLELLGYDVRHEHVQNWDAWIISW